MGRYDAVVIGAGIVGAACAYEFTRANLRVAIVEENDPGSGATDAGMGHLLIMGDSEAEFALTRYSLELWHSLADSLPSECGYWECGTIWVAADEEELRLARRKCEYYNSNGVAAELLDVRQIADAEPNLRPDLAGALLVQRDAAIHPRLAVRFLLDSALQKGAELISDKRAVSLNDTGVHLSDGTSLSGGSNRDCCFRSNSRSPDSRAKGPYRACRCGSEFCAASDCRARISEERA
jgi:D-hydroxyproline dehydrogenase subunit beta